MGWVKKVILAVVILICLLMAAFTAFIIVTNDRCVSEIAKSYQPFDAKKWIEADAKGVMETYRILVIEDLLTRKNFKGWTKAQVLGLLGEPTQTDKFQSYDIVYWLGPDRSCMRIDSEWLVFTLKDGKVGSYSVISD